MIYRREIHRTFNFLRLQSLSRLLAFYSQFTSTRLSEANRFLFLFSIFIFISILFYFICTLFACNTYSLSLFPRIVLSIVDFALLPHALFNSDRDSCIHLNASISVCPSLTSFQINAAFFHFKMPNDGKVTTEWNQFESPFLIASV